VITRYLKLRGDLLKIGSWFEYKVTESQSDLDVEKVWKEKYIVVSFNQKEIVFDYYKNEKKLEQVIGNKDYANGIIRTDDLSEVGLEKLNTPFGKINTYIYDSNRCGGRTKIFTDAEGIMYKSIEDQLWSMGIRHSITRELIDKK